MAVMTELIMVDSLVARKVVMTVLKPAALKVDMMVVMLVV